MVKIAQIIFHLYEEEEEEEKRRKSSKAGKQKRKEHQRKKERERDVVKSLVFHRKNLTNTCTEHTLQPASDQ